MAGLLLKSKAFTAETQRARRGFIVVIPAEAGIHDANRQKRWIPACAGMTVEKGMTAEKEDNNINTLRAL